jgi:hypothetical protein
MTNEELRHLCDTFSIHSNSALRSRLFAQIVSAAIDMGKAELLRDKCSATLGSITSWATGEVRVGHFKEYDVVNVIRESLSDETTTP